MTKQPWSRNRRRDTVVAKPWSRSRHREAVVAKPWSVAALTLVFLISALVDPATSETSGDGASPTSALAVRQDRVKRMMSDLEEKLIRLASTIETTEPEQAARLVETLHTAKQQRIEQRMASVVRLLSELELDQAVTGQERILADLRSLITILLREEDDLDQQRELIRQLDQWRSMIQKLIEQELRQKAEANKAADPDRAVRELSEQIERLRELIKNQQTLKQQTTTTRAKGISGLGKLADAQGDLRQQTRQLAAEIDEVNADGNSATMAKPNGQTGQQELKSAENQQHAAEENLHGAKGKAAEQHQAKALAHMQRALNQLQQEKDRIAKLSPSHFEQLADAEAAIAGRTGGLAKEMAEAQQSEMGQSDGQAEGSEAGGQPGQAQVQQAAQSMRRASSQLRQRNAKQATQDQQNSIDKLRQALGQVEDRLAQLRQAIQEDILASLESRFSQMLSRQKPLTTATSQLDETLKQRAWARGEQLLCSNISREERLLSEMAQEALHMIVEDGTTVVLPRIVQALHDDLESVTELTAHQKTDRYTQSLQHEIEQALEELVGALSRALEEQEASPGGASGGSSEATQQPLVQQSAELKLLQAAQIRINRQTRDFDETRPPDLAPDLDADLDPVRTRQIQRIAKQQQYVAELAEDMIEGRMSDFGETE